MPAGSFLLDSSTSQYHFDWLNWFYWNMWWQQYSYWAWSQNQSNSLNQPTWDTTHTDQRPTQVSYDEFFFTLFLFHQLLLYLFDSQQPLLICRQTSSGTSRTTSITRITHSTSLTIQLLLQRGLVISRDNLMQEAQLNRKIF